MGRIECKVRELRPLIEELATPGSLVEVSGEDLIRQFVQQARTRKNIGVEFMELPPRLREEALYALLRAGHEWEFMFPLEDAGKGGSGRAWIRNHARGILLPDGSIVLCRWVDNNHFEFSPYDYESAFCGTAKGFANE